MTHVATRRLTLAACALLLLAGTPFRSDATTRATPKSHSRAKPASRPGAKRATTATAVKPPSDPNAASPGGMPRTLDDVHIEGEIPVPQVLFITARDQRRFMDFQHHRYTRTSTQLGEATPFPTWVAVTHGQPIDPKKETSR